VPVPREGAGAGAGVRGAETGAGAGTGAGTTGATAAPPCPSGADVGPAVEEAPVWTCAFGAGRTGAGAWI
jgi:hypothetical protein